MATLTVRNLDDSLKLELRVQAARHGRSMEEEVRVILRAAIEKRPAQPKKRNPFLELHRSFQEIGGVDMDEFIPPRQLMRPLPDFAE